MTKIILKSANGDLSLDAAQKTSDEGQWPSKCSQCSCKCVYRSCTGLTVSAYRGNRQAWKEFAMEATSSGSVTYLKDMNFQCVRAGAEIG